jgi:hypothetical protein
MTTTIPDVPVPPGFEADDWQHNDSGLSHRVLLGETRRITGRRDFDTVRVQPTAVQFSDGSIDDGGVFEPPQVYVGDQSLPAPQARELIAALTWATETIERWTAE